jgi:DNA processing protein
MSGFDKNETLLMMALSRVPHLSLRQQKILVDTMGSAATVWDNRKDIQDIIPRSHKRLAEGLQQMDSLIAGCRKEMEWAEGGHIQCIPYTDPRYPRRLRDCDDPPMVLFYRGTADLNARHILSIVGTRQITGYGRDVIARLVRDLAQECPDIVIVSGLAYGVDIYSHRAALENKLETVAVLAHGLDQIYPTLHRPTAIQMLAQGGLLTEFPSATPVDKFNFVQRNRIVAGCSDATIVIESAAKGGSLITAELAQDYGREVFAVPGRITDQYSAGCNKLIDNNGAHALLDARSLLDTLGWSSTKATSGETSADDLPPVPGLSAEEQTIVNALQGHDRYETNQLSRQTGIPIGKLSGILLSMEMKGIVSNLPGACVKLTI